MVTYRLLWRSLWHAAEAWASCGGSQPGFRKVELQFQLLGPRLLG